jgi:hypothetical protein
LDPELRLEAVLNGGLVPPFIKEKGRYEDLERASPVSQKGVTRVAQALQPEIQAHDCPPEDQDPVPFRDALRDAIEAAARSGSPWAATYLRQQARS